MARRKKDEDRITLTEARLEAIRVEKRRTQVGSITLLKSAPNAPDDLKPNMIDGWLAGGAKTTAKRHFDFVLSAYRVLPDDVPNRNRPIAGDATRLPVTEAMRAFLERVHADAPQGYLKAAPGGFTPVSMAHLLSGRDKTIAKEVWTFLRTVLPLYDASVFPELLDAE